MSSLCATALLTGCAVAPPGTPGASPGNCAAYAYRAIEHHVQVTRQPAACSGLTPAQVSLAAGVAIRESVGGRAKARARERTAAAARWVGALITQPSPVPSPPPASAESGGSGSSGRGPLGGVSDLAAAIAALLAWLVTAASGGYVLLRWLLAGGSLRRPGIRSRHGARRRHGAGRRDGAGRSDDGAAAPPAVTAGHAGLALTGLAGWTLFTITGWAWLAWTCLVVLLPAAGLGMGVLLLGLPAPRRGVTTVVRGKRGVPWLVIAAHGVAAVTLLLLVIAATVAAS